MTGFASALRDGVLVCDGAMGTMLHAAGNSLDRALPELNLSNAELVAGARELPVSAGVDVIQTNTFGASALRLAEHGSTGPVREINLAGVRIAREALDKAGRRVFVAGSVSPAVTAHQRPLITPAQRVAAIREQVSALAEGGVDVLILETFGYLDELAEAVTAGRGTHRRADHRAGHVHAGRPHAGRRDPARGGDRPVRAAGRRAGHQLHARPAAHAHGGHRADPAHAAAGECPAQRRAAPAGGRAAVRVPHRRRVLRQVRAPVRRSGRVADRRVLRHHAHPPASRPWRRSPRSARRPGGPPRAPRPRLAGRPRRGGAGRAGGTARRRAVRGRRGDRPARRRHRRRGRWTPSRRSATKASSSVLVSPRQTARAQLEPAERGPAAAPAARRRRHRHDDHLGQDHHGAAGRPARRARARACGPWSAPPATRRCAATTRTSTASGRSTRSGLVELLAGLNEGRDSDGLTLATKTSFHIGARFNPGARDVAAEVARTRAKLRAGAQFLITRPVYELDTFRRMTAELAAGRCPCCWRSRRCAASTRRSSSPTRCPGVTIPEATLRALERAGRGAAGVGLDLAAGLAAQARHPGPRRGAAVTAISSPWSGCARRCENRHGAGGRGPVGRTRSVPPSFVVGHKTARPKIVPVLGARRSIALHTRKMIRVKMTASGR